MQNYFEQVAKAADFFKKRVKIAPQLILVLSGGLEAFLDKVEQPIRLASSEVPLFPKARSEGHKGELNFGSFQKMPLVVLDGRYHFYEGLSPQEVVFPYFVLHALGAKVLVTTNAVGGVREDLNPGDLMLIEDHINMMGTNPLIGLTVQNPKNQFPSMQNAYDALLRALAIKVAKEKKIDLKQGTYLANPGPSYETPAEIKMYRSFGADTVGMSTVFETQVARFLQMRVLALNIITNVASDRHTGKMTHQEVLVAMQKAQQKVLQLLEGILSGLAQKT